MNESKLTESPYVSTYEPEPDVLYAFGKLQYLENTIAGNVKFDWTRNYNDIHENTIFARPIGNTSSVLAAEKKITAWLDSHVVKCLTVNPINSLMWAHYADDHKGVCIGFSFKKLKDKILDGHPLRHIAVRYSSTPPLTLVQEPLDNHTVMLLALDILHTKSIHWAYEQEYRFYIETQEPLKEKGSSLTLALMLLSM